MKRPLSLVTVIPLFVHSASSAPECSICSTDIQALEGTDTATATNLANPNALIPVSLQEYTTPTITCHQLNEQLKWLVPSIDTADDLAECEALISQKSTMVDITSYCGCHDEGIDASIQNTGCSFCSLDDTTDPNLVTDFKNLTDNSNTQQWTCGDLVSLAPYVKDTSLCQEIQDYMSDCCNDSDGGDTVLEQSIMTCTLCGATPRAADSSPEGKSYPAGGSIMVMGFLNRSIPVTVTGRSSSSTSNSQQWQTCQEINEALSQDPLILNNGEDGSQACSEQRDSWMMEQDIYLDLSSYCGCPNSPAPRICEFACASGSSNAIHEEMVVHKLADGTKLTCGDILSAIPYIVDFDVCQDYQKYQSLCCANFEASCHLCQEESSSTQPKHPEKIIPSLQRTCGLMDQYFGTVLDVNNNDTIANQECNDYRAAKNEDAIVDLESYCGCENHHHAMTTPSTCDFCGVENLEKPNLLFKDVLSSGGHQHHHEAIHKLDEWGIAGNSMTCRAVAELAPIVTNDNFCQDLQYFRPICCPDFEPTCTMCGPSSSSVTLLTRPNAVIPGRSETCAEADQLQFHLIQGNDDNDNDAACNAQRNGFHTDMNVAAYCGCPGQEPPNQCNFCNASDLIDSEMVIGIGSEARTCGYLAQIAPFLTNQTLCSWVEFAKPQCCQPKVDEPCSICSNKNAAAQAGADGEIIIMSRPNNIVEHQKGTTCQELDQTIQQLPRDICTQVKGDWDFDLESFCGCKGSPVMDRCDLCGKGQVLRNHSVALPDKPSWTCEMGQNQAPFVNSKVVCGSEINTEANVKVCCEPASSASNSPTSSPSGDKDDQRTTTTKPISQAIEEAGLSDTMLWLATLVEVLIILVFLLLRKHELTAVRDAPPRRRRPPQNLAPASIPETAALI